MSDVDLTTATTYDTEGGIYDEGIYDNPDVIVGADTLLPSPAVPMNYSDVALPTTLSRQAQLTDNVLNVHSTSGYPDPPFQISLDAGTALQEICLVGGVTPNSFTSVTRNYNGKGAFVHEVNATVAHSTTAFDYTVLNHHYSDATIDWHGQYLDVFRHASPALHTCGVSLGYDAPQPSAPGDVGQEGTSAYVSCSDHQHARESLSAILQNAFVPGLGVMVPAQISTTFFWLQTAANAEPAPNSYSGFTSAGITIPEADYVPLSPTKSSIAGHVWTYLPIIDPKITFFHR